MGKLPTQKDHSPISKDIKLSTQTLKERTLQKIAKAINDNLAPPNSTLFSLSGNDSFIYSEPDFIDSSASKSNNPFLIRASSYISPVRSRKFENSEPENPLSYPAFPQTSPNKTISPPSVSPSSTVTSLSNESKKQRNLSLFNNFVNKLHSEKDPSNPFNLYYTGLRSQLFLKKKNILWKSKLHRLPKRNLKPLDFSLSKKKSPPNDPLSTQTPKIPSFNDPLTSPNHHQANSNSYDPLHSNNSTSLNTIQAQPQSPSQKPLSNILKCAYDRMQAVKTNNKIQIDSVEKETNLLINQFGLNPSATQPQIQHFSSNPSLDPNLILSSNPISATSTLSSYEIQGAIEKALYQTFLENKDLPLNYSMWNIKPDSSQSSTQLLQSEHQPQNFSQLLPQPREPPQTNHVPTNLHHNSINPIKTENLTQNICIYCKKSFKSLPKKHSHEERCPSKLEAMLYSQPETIDNTDSKPNSNLVELASLLAHVPDYSETESENITYPPKSKRKRIASHPNSNLPEPNSKSIISQQSTPSLAPQKSQKISSSKKDSSKQSSTQKMLKPKKQKKKKLPDPDDTMSLSEGSELSRFHGRDTTNALFNSITQNNSRKRVRANGNEPIDSSVPDFIGLPLPPLQNINDTSIYTPKLEVSSATISNPQTATKSFTPLVSKPPTQWNVTPLVHYAPTANTEPQKIFYSQANFNTPTNYISNQQVQDMDFYSILQTLNQNSNNNNNGSANINAANPQSLPPKHSTLSQKDTQTPIDDQLFAINRISQQSMHVPPVQIPKKEHGSSSTITISPENENYQNMNDIPLEGITTNIPDSINKRPTSGSSVSFNLHGPGTSIQLAQSSSQNPFYSFQNQKNISKLDLNSLSNHQSPSYTNNNYMMGINFNSIQQQNTPTVLQQHARMTPIPLSNPESKNITYNPQDPFDTSNPAEAKNVNNISDLVDFSNLADIPLNQNFNEGLLLGNNSGNTSISDMLALGLINNNLNGQVDPSNMDSLFVNNPSQNIMDWNLLEENFDREFEGMINFD
ncbi:hypothetical protein BB560_003098 [Smittium megazygosporum]|uniref:Uncharacterized protein n=1 Tax=Smittium megazygosporum TaxID=133381 RepID=A0A2T9ZD27_9FUNG|nr:hypothetical protein BB560_003098 [Smittium megazygosporum]